MFETIKKAKESLDALMRELKDSESTLSNATNEYNSILAKQNIVKHELMVLEERRNTLDLEVKSERKKQIDEIDQKLRDVSDLKAQVESEKQKLHFLQSENIRKSVEWDALKDETQRNLTELTKRQAVLDEKIKQINEFKDVLSK